MRKSYVNHLMIINPISVMTEVVDRDSQAIGKFKKAMTATATGTWISKRLNEQNLQNNGCARAD